MKQEERRANTYVGSAEIRKENTTRRDNLVNAAKAAGFLVDCTEAISISLSGKSSPEYWAITVYAPGKLDRAGHAEAHRKLAAAWRGL